jgi:hypothetical protein
MIIEKVQFYKDGAWSSWYNCIRPMNGDEKYDETLDKIQLSFVSTVAPYDRFTRARVTFSDDTLAYSNGVPTNHYEMVVDSSDVTTNDYYTMHNYSLLEATSVLKYIRMESLTFTSKDTITIREGGVDVTYTQSAYNLLSMIQRIFKVTRFKTSVEDNSLTSKIQIMDSALLIANLLNVDDEFVENTVYDALIKIGKYINRVPVLYFSKTGSYEYDLWFERKDGLGASSVLYSTFIADNQGIVKSQTSELGADTVVSDATNMVTYNVAQGVAQDWYGFSRFEDETTTVTATSTKTFLQLPHRIVGVIKLRVLQTNYDIVNFDYDGTYANLRCLNYTEWLIDENRDNIAYYKDGENKIYFGNTYNATVVSSLKAPAETGVRLYFNVKYYPLLDTKVNATKDGSITYEATFNQVDAFIDAGSYGLMLKEYIKTHGNADITLTKKHSAFTSMYAIGTRVIDGSTTYIVTSRSWKTKQDYMSVVYQLNKNATRRSQWVKASEKIREHGINYEKTQIRYSTIHEPIEIDFLVALDSFASYAPSSTNYLVSKDMLFANLFTTAQKNTYRNDFIQQCYVRARSTINKVGTGSVTNTEYCQLGFGSTRVGQSIILNIQFNDNKIAGYKVVPDTTISQSPVYYSDPFAQIETLSFGFGKYKDIASVIESSGDGTIFALTNSEGGDIEDYASTYPDLTSTDFDTYFASSMVKVNTYDYYKDGREIGNISYQLEFIGKNSTLFNNELLDYSGLLTKDKVQPTLYLVICNVGVELGENDIIISGQIDSVALANSPTLTNKSTAIEYVIPTGLSAYNQVIALCTSLGGGSYKPLIWKNNQTVELNDRVFIAY